jgi:hypothetical protein
MAGHRIASLLKASPDRRGNSPIPECDLKEQPVKDLAGLAVDEFKPSVAAR